MTDLTKYSPSTAVVHVALSELDSLRFSLVEAHREIDKLKDSKAEVIVKERRLEDHRTYRRGESPKSSQYVDVFLEFRKFDDFEQVVRKQEEAKVAENFRQLQVSHDFYKQRSEEAFTKIKELNTSFSDTTIELNTTKEQLNTTNKLYLESLSTIEGLNAKVSSLTLIIKAQATVLRDESILGRIRKWLNF